MKAQRFCWTLLLCLACWLSTPLLAAERVALVIGNGTYSGANPLSHAGNDARALAALLEQLGFQVIEGIDLDQAGMTSLVTEFQVAALGAKVAWFFYSGHGLHQGTRNYLLPVDTDFETATIDPMRWVALDTVEEALAGADARVLVLDAAWQNPLNNLAPGLATVEPLDNGLVALSAQPLIPVAYQESENSPFALALLEVLDNPRRDLGTLLVEAAAMVTRQSERQQLPWVRVDLDEPLRLNVPTALSTLAMDAEEASPEEETPAVRTNPGLYSQADRVEKVVFEAARGLRMPAMRDLALVDYLARYPRGHYVDEAQRLLEELRQGVARSDPAIVDWHPAVPIDEEEVQVASVPAPPPEPELSGPELAEQALGLSREQRREVQWALTALGFDTGGVDGLFGSRTRESIRAYQADRGLERSGFLAQDQWQRLLAEGEAPVAALKAREAEQARLAAIRREQEAAAAAAAAQAAATETTTVEEVQQQQAARVVTVNPELQLQLQRLQSELNEVRGRLQRERASNTGGRWTVQLDYQARIDDLERQIQNLQAQVQVR